MCTFSYLLRHLAFSLPNHPTAPPQSTCTSRPSRTLVPPPPATLPDRVTVVAPMNDVLFLCLSGQSKESRRINPHRRRRTLQIPHCPPRSTPVYKTISNHMALPHRSSTPPPGFLHGLSAATKNTQHDLSLSFRIDPTRSPLPPYALAMRSCAEAGCSRRSSKSSSRTSSSSSISRTPTMTVILADLTHTATMDGPDCNIVGRQQLHEVRLSAAALLCSRRRGIWEGSGRNKI
jgi:hypothetical protein